MALDSALVAAEGFALLAVLEIAHLDVEEDIDFPGAEGVADEFALEELTHEPIELGEDGFGVEFREPLDLAGGAVHFDFFWGEIHYSASRVPVLTCVTVLECCYSI